VWIGSGSRNETAKNNGVAHFLEHMAFKGTKTRSQQQIEAEIEKMGGHVNAYTDREQTVYYAKVLKNDVPAAMEMMSDILTNPLHDEAAIEKERATILTEMEDANRQYEEQVLDQLHATAFMGTSLARNALGPKENVLSLKRSDLQEYMKAQHTADKFVIAGAGAVDHKQLVDLSEKHFGGLAPTGAAAPASDAVFTGSDIRIRYDSMKQAHVAFAFQGCSSSSEDYFPLMMVQTILGSWDVSSGAGRSLASRLAQDAAGNNLCHTYKAFNICYKDTGLFGISLVAPDNKLDDSMYFITENFVRLSHNVTDEEIVRAKTQLKANMLMQLDSNVAICEDIGRQMLAYGRRIPNAELFARIDAITTDDIKKTALKYFNDEDHALAAVGPVFELPDYNWIRRRSYWHRY
jgi:processing peptidase subunit beta